MKTQKVRMILLCAVLALLLPNLAVAEPLYCKGTVRDLVVFKNGAVWVNGSWRGTWTQMCNLKEEWKGVDTSVCFGWYNLLLTIQREEGAVAWVMYEDMSQTCSDMPIKAAAEAPGYVMMR